MGEKNFENTIIYRFSVDVSIDDALCELARKTNLTVDHLLTSAVVEFLINHGLALCDYDLPSPAPDPLEDN